MLKKFWAEFKDEAIGTALLYFLLKHGRQRPVIGTLHHEFPDLLAGDLTRFCRPTPQPVDLQANRQLYKESEKYRVDDIRFQSSVPSAFPESDTVIVRHWASKAAIRSDLTIVGLDGLGQIGSGWFWRLADNVTEAGIDVAMMDTPFNYRRTPPGYRAGQLILGGDLAHQLSVSRQAILDVWTLIISLQAEGRRVGLTGISFGGWLSLMAGCVAEDLDFIYSLAPPADLGTIVEEGGTVIRAMRRGLGYKTIDRDLLTTASRAVTPKFWTPKLDPQNITLFAAKYDRFVPLARIEELATTWGTHYELFNDGHIGIAAANFYKDLVGQRIVEREGKS